MAPEHLFEGLYEVRGYDAVPLTGHRKPFTIELQLRTNAPGEPFRFALSRDQAHWLAEQLERESR